MGDQNPEVRIRLIIDDQSAATLAHVKAGMHEVDAETHKAADAAGQLKIKIEQVVEHQHHAAEGAKGMAGEVVKGGIYFELMKKGAEAVVEVIKQGVEATEKLVEASIEAAEAQEQQERQMAGFLMLMDGGKHSMAELRVYTAGQREEFEKFGLTAGVAVGDLVKTYDKLIERGAMSSEKAHEMAEQMAIVGRVVPGGMEGLAQGMSGVEMGMVRARNPVVQLIAATHLLQGNAKEVASQMQKMSPERQMALAEEAINKQAVALKKMGAAAPNLGQLKTSFEGVKEGFLESMGGPMIATLVPQLTRLRDYLAEHMEQIKAFGEKIGEAAGQAITYVSNVIEGVYSGLTYNWDEFKATFQDIFADWEAAWGSAHMTSQEIKQELFAVGITLRDIFIDIAKTIRFVTDRAMDVYDLARGHMAGETREKVEKQALGALAADPRTTQKQFAEAIARFESASKLAHLGFNVERTDTVAAMQGIRAHQTETSAHEASMVQTMDKAQGPGADQTAWAEINQELVNNAHAHNDAQNEYLLQQLAGSEKGAAMIVQHHDELGKELGNLTQMIADASPELAAKIRKLSDTVKQEDGIKAPKFEQHFHGGIHIKQDFKDQDPDRVILTFTKDLQHAAANRTTARTSSPFGW